MKTIVLSSDRFFAQSILTLSRILPSAKRTLYLLDVMNIPCFPHAVEAITPGENHTLAFVVNHVNHLDFLDSALLIQLSRKMNIAVISRKAQRFEYEALFTNSGCHIKNANFAEKGLSPSEVSLIHAMYSGTPVYRETGEEVSRKSLSAHKRALMKKNHVASDAELYDVIRKNTALSQALSNGF